jgi:hypothetical protein
MENIETFCQLEKLIEENNLSNNELSNIIKNTNNLKVKFGIACILDDQVAINQCIDATDDLESLYFMIPSSNASLSVELFIKKTLSLTPINSSNDARNFLLKNSFFSQKDIESSNSFNIPVKIALLQNISPNSIKDNKLDQELLIRYDLGELSNFLNDTVFLENAIPLNPIFFVNHIIKLEPNIIKNYLTVLQRYNFSLAEYFDAISSVSQFLIRGKIIVDSDSYSFEFQNKTQEILFQAFDVKYKIHESDAIYTEKQLGVKEIDGELYLRNNLIIADIRTEELTTIESVKTQLMTVLSMTVTTIGKVASSPKTKVAMLALSTFGIMGESFAGEISSESDVASILNKLEKAHTLKGFEGGRQFNALDAQLEQVGVDLNDLKFPANFNHRTIRFSGEEGEYSLKMADTTVLFEYNDDGIYTATIKNIDGSKGLIDGNDLKDWANKITGNLNKAAKESEK